MLSVSGAVRTISLPPSGGVACAGEPFPLLSAKASPFVPALPLGLPRLIQTPLQQCRRVHALTRFGDGVPCGPRLVAFRLKTPQAGGPRIIPINRVSANTKIHGASSPGPDDR